VKVRVKTFQGNGEVCHEDIEVESMTEHEFFGCYGAKFHCPDNEEWHDIFVPDEDYIIMEEANNACGEISENIFEIRNITSDEVYHSLGFAKSLEEAKKMIHENDKNPATMDDVYDGHFVIGVFQRQFGWSGYDHEKYCWKIVYDEVELDDGEDYELQITFEGEPEK
jgi:hypothetical protein